MILIEKYKINHEITPIFARKLFNIFGESKKRKLYIVDPRN